MKKEKTSKIKEGMRKVILKTADIFSEFESTKSIPFWCYEVKMPEELKKK